tara:strand:- start:1172 stop:1510 length:339 start_codon:yes stop_codon:yes gene_type:complete
MALERGKLSDIVKVSAGSTVGIITVASSKKVYVKSIAAFDVTGAGSTAHVYIIPNGGSVGDGTKLYDVTLTANETALIEPSYPIVLDTTGDKISVGTTGADVNFFITGDKEA